MFKLQKDLISKAIVSTFLVPVTVLFFILFTIFYFSLQSNYKSQEELALDLGTDIFLNDLQFASNNETFQPINLKSAAHTALALEGIQSISFYRPNKRKTEEYGQPISAAITKEISKLLKENNNKSIKTIADQTYCILKLTHAQQFVGWVVISLDAKGFSLFSTKTLLSLLVLGLVVFLGLIYLVGKLYNAVASPLYKMRNTLKQTIKEQKPSETLTLSDEIYEDLNKLSATLITLYHDEKHATNEAIIQATAELKDHLESVEIQNIELDISRKNALKESQAKSEFLANTSHEFRTPLNGILGFTSLLFKTPLTAQQKEYLKTIEQSSQGLLTVISDVLDYSRLESGKLQLEYKPVNIREIVEEVSTIHAASAVEKQLRILSFVNHDIHPHLLGDPQRLKQVVTNLVSNAIKFSSHGNIIINASIIKEQDNAIVVRVSVSDEGIGLSSEQHPKLFKAFTEEVKPGIQSRGLGLAVAKGLIESMHGEIGVSSRENEGSEFWFTVQLGVNRDRTLSQQQKHFAECKALIYDADDMSRKSLAHLLDSWQIHSDEINVFDKLKSLTREDTEQYSLALIDAEQSQYHFDEKNLLETTQHLNNNCDLPVIIVAPPKIQRSISAKIDRTKATAVNRPTAYTVVYHAIKSLLQQPSDNQFIEDGHFSESVFSNNQTHVLVVDDNPANLRLVSEFLKGLHVDCTTAQNGAQAIEKCANTDFDLILMDIQMPVLDGLEATKKIRENEEGAKRTPIVALTAHAVNDHKSELLLVGMDDYLSKPISEAELKHIIRRWVINVDQLDAEHIEEPASNNNHDNDKDKDKNNVVESTPSDSKTETTESSFATEDSSTSENSSAAENSSTAENSKPPSPQPQTHSSESQTTKNKPKLVSIGESLELAKDKPDLAFDMFKMLLDSLPATKEELQYHKKNNELEQIRAVAHKLHGGCCYCGVPALRAASKELEKAVEVNATTAEIGQKLDHLIEEINKLNAWVEEVDLEILFGLDETE